MSNRAFELRSRVSARDLRKIRRDQATEPGVINENETFNAVAAMAAAIAASDSGKSPAFGNRCCILRNGEHMLRRVPAAPQQVFRYCVQSD